MLDTGDCILWNLYSRGEGGLWKTCHVLEYGQSRDGHSTQYSQLFVWNSLFHSSQDRCDLHVDPDLEPQTTA